MKTLTAALARVCKTLNKYEIAHDDKPPPKRAAAEVFRVLPSSKELLTLYTTTLRSDIAFGWYAEDVTLYAISNLLQRHSSFTATSRSSFVSRARKTCPMPPSPPALAWPQ